MHNSLYPCGTTVDARKPVNYARLKWTDVFVRSRRYFRTYNVNDMRHWLDVVAQVQFLGLPTYEYSSGGSPAGHAEGIEYYFALLDGGLACHDFWGLRNGCQVMGYNCVRYFCYQLGLKQPRRLRDEKYIPTLESLGREVKFQQSSPAQQDELKQNIERLRERFI